MYCSACGVAVAQGLSYCNFCGAKVTRADGAGKELDVRPESLIFGMLATFVFGMIAITVLMGVMKAVLGLQVETILVAALLPFLIMIVLEAVFIRLLWRRTHGTHEPDATALAKGQATNELDAAHARALPEARPSVTEHTTRAFDPIYTDRKPQ